MVLARGCNKMGGVECLLGDAIKWGVWVLARGCNKKWGVGLGLRSWVLARGCNKMGELGAC